MFSSHSTHRCDAGVNAGMTLHTFDLLFIPEPAQVSGGLAALGDAGQSDVVSLHGGLCQAIDLWLLWHTWRMEKEITAMAELIHAQQGVIIQQ